MCPVKTQISLGIHPVWSESSLCAQWVAKDPRFLHADSNNSDQIGQMPRLIWVYAGCTGHFVGFVMLWLHFFPVSKEELETLAITCHRICVVSSKKVLTEWQAWNELPHDKTNRLTCAPSKDSDQPGHLPSLIRVFADHMKKHWTLNYLLSVQWRLWSDWGDAQVDLSLRWAHMSFCWFCRSAAHMCSVSSKNVPTEWQSWNVLCLQLRYQKCLDAVHRYEGKPKEKKSRVMIFILHVQASLYNAIHYNTVLNITGSCLGSQVVIFL